MANITVKPGDVLRAKRFCTEELFWESYHGAGLTEANMEEDIPLERVVGLVGLDYTLRYCLPEAQPQDLAIQFAPLFAAEVAETIALPLWKKVYPADDRPEVAINAAKDVSRIIALFQAGTATEEDLARAEDAAGAAAEDAARAAGDAARAAGAAAGAAARAAAWDAEDAARAARAAGAAAEAAARAARAAEDAAGAAARAARAAGAAAGAAARAAAWDAARQTEIAIFRSVLLKLQQDAAEQAVVNGSAA